MRKKLSGTSVKWLAIVISFILSVGLILTVAIPETYDYKVGDICTEDVYATREIEDTATTKRRREAAANQVENQYVINYVMNEELTRSLQKLFSEITQARSMDIELSGKVSFVREDLGFDMDDENITMLVASSADEYGAFTKSVREVFSEVMDGGVHDVTKSLETMGTMLEARGLVGDELETAGIILAQYIKVNEEYDEELTMEEKSKAMQRIEPTVYKKNQIIARRGEAISEEQLMLLSSLGLIKGSTGINIKYVVGIILFVLIAYFAGGYYIQDKKNMRTQKLLLLLLLPVVTFLIVLLLRGMTGARVYLIPIPVCAILTAIFIGMKLATVASIYMTFATCIMLSQSEDYIIAMVLISVAGAMIFKRVSGLSGYAKAMLLYLVAGAFISAMVMLIGGKELKDVLKTGIFSTINCVISSIIVVGTTPVIENIFDILTPFKLNDLGDPEKPLLKRLMFEAPGTYHHSLMVGNLAEAACIKIGADNQLARVASYYHDIGKLRRPEYFVENQIGGNPHDYLDPKDSAEVLRSHVEYGLEIAKQNRLPREIKEVISQHHGTTVTGIFYKKELELNGEADESLFKYKGPKPESKETGIVMLADSCEAAVRSLDDKSEENIRAMVTKIVKGRMTDGQLDRCNLSFRELGEIIESFVAMLGSYFHKRINYDKESANELNN